MPTNDFSTSGTIKVKNADGVLVPFHPKTKTDCIQDSQSNKSLTTILSELEENVEIAANSGGVKVVYEVNNDTLESFGSSLSAESMTVAIAEEVWNYSVTITENDMTTGIPFNLYGTESTMEVLWGDGTSSTLTASSFPSGNVSNALHTYETAGIYNIVISCDDWSKVYYFTSSYHEHGSYPYYSWYLSNAYVGNIYHFRQTLHSMNNSFPCIKGVKRYSTATPSSYSNTLTSSETDYSYMFVDCRNLTNIPKYMFDNIPSIENFNSCFCDCYKIQAIPARLFDKHVLATDFGYCFGHTYYGEGITAIEEIPENLFKYNTEATNFERCFVGCRISSIPEDVFKFNTKATDFTECFSDTRITSIPPNLFKYNTEALSFNLCFDSCPLSAIPEHLFDTNTKATNFRCCFQHAGNFTSIPENLFANCTKATNFLGCFNGANIPTIPENLFANCPDAENFSSCFSGCYHVTEIPENLFKYNTKATDFSHCFWMMPITEIPANLFKYNTKATNFSSCFCGCTGVSEIPEHLFDACTLATDFRRCFGGFDNIMSYTFIPENIFRYNTLATNFSECFAESSITTIPSNLFNYHANVTTFQYCFEKCSKLNDFSIHVASRVVSNCGVFVTKKNNTSRTVYVPSGSTTQTAFNNVASSLGLTIIGE